MIWPLGYTLAFVIPAKAEGQNVELSESWVNKWPNYSTILKQSINMISKIFSPERGWVHRFQDN